METKDSTHLWLNLKKDYIDDNFEHFQKYLKKCVKNNDKDFFYETTIDLYRKWINEIIKHIASHPLYEEHDEALVKKNVSLLATYLLVEDEEALSLPAYVALMSQLCILKPKFKTHIVDATRNRLKNNKVIKLGYSWEDLENICSDIFAYKASSLSEFNEPINVPRIYSNNGTAFVSENGVCLTDEQFQEAIKLYHSGQDCLSTSIGFTLRTSNRKLKTTSNKDLQAIQLFLKGFIRNQIENNHSDKRSEKDNVDKEAYIKIDPIILELLLRFLFIYQSNLVDPAERYCILSHSRVMAEMIGDSVSSSYIQFAQTYLMALEKFANDENGDISDIVLEPSEDYKESKAAKIRIAVVKLLKLYGEKSEDKILSNAIQEYSVEYPKLTKLAILIQSSNLLKKDKENNDDNILLTIKKQINKVLGIQTEEEKGVDLEAKAGINLGQESGRQENKTSIVFPAENNMQPDVKKQQFIVMKGICGFLNSPVGGTLYLGVDDWGNVKGIENDLKYLKERGDYYRVESTDGYKNYINTIIINFFGKDVARFTHIIDHTNNGKVYIEIVVDSYPYGIVRIKEQAYLRFNNSSREIDEDTCRNILAEKTIYNNDVTRAIKILQQARHEKKCVILKGYASNHSKSVKDRNVEPFDIDSTNNIVWCYDRDKDRNATFKINRIRCVEIIADKRWENEEKHNKGNLDIFNISSSPLQQQTHIKLEMDLVARNMLIEEFPLAEKYISHDTKDNNKWYLSVDVNRIDDVARFYMGLADCISITNAPELEKHIEKYAKEYLKWAFDA